ncbi:MAG: hypothetical protein K5882_10740 [Bacteroidales bacterium]|nr:hypothetical protein [Bacteroidales bacterium]
MPLRMRYGSNVESTIFTSTSISAASLALRNHNVNVVALVRLVEPVVQQAAEYNNTKQNPHRFA